MVIVVEENEAQTYSMKRSAFFDAYESVMDMGLGDLGINLPKSLERAIDNIRGVRGDLLRAIRKAYARMAGNSLPSVSSSAPRNCYADMLGILSQGLTSGPKPGKVFMDRYGEAAYAYCLRDMAAPYYERVVTLTDRQATFPNFKKTVEDLHAAGYTMDLFLDIHGTGPSTEMNNGHQSKAKLFFTPATGDNGEATIEMIESINGGNPMRLNAVYLVSCWGSLFNPSWTKLGAKASNGARELNYYVLLSPVAFMAAWTQGASLEDAAKVAYRVEQNLLNGHKTEINFSWRDPITRQKHSAGGISIGATWTRLMNRILGKQYGDNKNKPINNEASSERIHAGARGISRA
jgi:hypothetical protein